MPKTGDAYSDADGRQFTLTERMDPRGPITAYWRVHHADTGIDTTVREDRLGTDYTAVDEHEDGRGLE